MKKKGKKKHLALILQNQPPIIAPVPSLCLEKLKQTSENAYHWIKACWILKHRLTLQLLTLRTSTLSTRYFSTSSINEINKLVVALPLQVMLQLSSCKIVHDRSNVSSRERIPLPWILLPRSESKHVYDRETRISYLDRRLSYYLRGKLRCTIVREIQYKRGRDTWIKIVGGGGGEERNVDRYVDRWNLY